MANVDDLYAAYMPFIKNGGLFVNVRRLADAQYSLGSDVGMVLRLSGEDDQLRAPGRVVWLTPWSRDQETAGIGVQFQDDGQAQSRIEHLLAGMLHSEQQTLTL